MIPDGLMWNEAVIKRGDPLYAGFVCLLVIKDDLQPELIGTAFIVKADGNRATAFSAAHNFDYIKRVLHPHPNHNASALPEFLPPPKEIDIKQVKGMYLKGDKVVDCAIEIAIWDSATDLAVLTIIAPENEPDLFCDAFWIDNQIPDVDEHVVMIGFGEMKAVPDTKQSNGGLIQHRLIQRLGRVEGIYPDGYLLLKTPSVKTSISIFSGMSGGLVARWSENSTQIMPFAIISYAPEPQPSYNRAESGQSVGSLLNAALTSVAENTQRCEIKVNNIGVGRIHNV